jgi:DNA adenine methylase
MSKLAISPLRYPGGKSKALDQIFRHIPANFTEYREPFVGGGSVFLALKKLLRVRVNQFWLNDLNQDLIHFWRYMRDDPNLLIEQITLFRDGYDDGRELYSFLKSENNMRSDIDRAVRFFIMNRITFSGVMDAGGYSQQAFERRFTQSSIDRLKVISPYLKETKITFGDYEEAVCSEGENVFLFLDPPYWSATESRLYGKRGELHTSFDHERFAAVMQNCPHRWLITYDDSEKIRALFRFAEIIEWELQYGMNNFKQDTAAKGRELFIRNF